MEKLFKRFLPFPITYPKIKLKSQKIFIKNIKLSARSFILSEFIKRAGRLKSHGV